MARSNGPTIQSPVTIAGVTAMMGKQERIKVRTCRQRKQQPDQNSHVQIGMAHATVLNVEGDIIRTDLRTGDFNTVQLGLGVELWKKKVGPLVVAAAKTEHSERQKTPSLKNSQHREQKYSF